MTTKRVLVDLDGVVIDLLESIRQIMADKGLKFEEKNIKTYNFDGNIGCSKQDVYALFNEVSTYKNAEPYSGALEALEKLKQYVTVVPYTSVNENKLVFNYRKQLLQDMGFIGSEPYIDRKPILEGYDALFEDDPYKVEEWGSCSTKIYLIDHTYNRELVGTYFTRCNNFVEAVDKYISELENSNT